MNSISLQKIAELVNGRLLGDPNAVVWNADIIRDAAKGYVTFAEKPDFLEAAGKSDAEVVILPEALVEDFQNSWNKNSIAVENVAVAFGQVVQFFRPPAIHSATGIAKEAIIDPSASLGNGVWISAGVSIGADVEIGDQVRIHPGVRILEGSRIGAGSEIFPGAVIYCHSVIGQNCILHANCVIGSYGFGYESDGNGHKLCPQLGNVEIGDEVEIGAGTTIDRGTYGATRIGDGSKLDNQVQIGHNCRLGKRNLICAQVGIAGSCTTGDDVVMAGQVGVGDHTDIGNMVVIGAKSGVMADITDKQVLLGTPATPAKQQMTIVAATHRLPEMRKKLNRLERQLTALIESIAKEEENDHQEPTHSLDSATGSGKDSSAA